MLRIVRVLVFINQHKIKLVGITATHVWKIFQQTERIKQQIVEIHGIGLPQARHIAQQLAFDDETTAKFVDTYSRCQKEVWSLAPRKRVGKGASKTDRETEEAIEERFDRSQKLLDIRKKYYKEYSKFLTPKQIQRVYSIEKNMMKRLGKNANRRKNRRP